MNLKRWSWGELIFFLFCALALCGGGRAAELNYTTSWIGDSFFDHRTNPVSHIPDWLGGVAVAPNGTVFTAGYAEAGGGGASFKDGKFAGRYQGFAPWGFGGTTDDVAADASWVYFCGDNGIQRYAYGGSGTPNARLLEKTVVLGLAIHGNVLYAADYTNSKIRMIALDTFKETGSFPAVRPGKIAVDHSGRMWVVQLRGDAKQGIGFFPGEKIVSYGPDGKPGATIDDVPGPYALAVDAKNELLVGNDGADCRIRYYANLGAMPKLARTFGTENGLSSPPAGKLTARRFHWIRGIALDAAGNLYVGCVYGVWWGETVQAYSPWGSLKWQVSGTDYCDCATIDPRSETDVYDSIHHYVLDYNKAPGEQWRLAGLTVDDVKYPNDLRFLGQGNGFRQGTEIRYIRGHKFLLVSDQGGYPLWFFRFEQTADRETAIPSAAFGGGSPDKISRDANGDGKFEPEEVRNGAAGYFSYHYVTNDGDVWRISQDGPIVEYPLQGMDVWGNPIYTAQSAKLWPLPKEFALKGPSPLRSLTYDKATDTMYLGGGIYSQDGSGSPHLCRFDHFKGASGHARVTRWDIHIPSNDTSYTPQTGYGGGTATVVRVAGKYVFICYGMGYVRIHDRNTGNYVGTLIPHLPGFDGGGGQVDAAYGMSVRLRSNGEYVVLTENAGGNHIIMMRWKPI